AEPSSDNCAGPSSFHLLTYCRSYLPADRFLDRVDAARVGQLVSDNRIAVTPGALLTHPKVLAALQDASGDLERACTAGRRYLPAELAAIALADGTPAQGYLFRLLTALALHYLVLRRGGPPDEQVQHEYERAQQEIDRLKNGELVFPFEETQGAGLPQTNVYTDADYRALRLLSVQFERYYGRRTSK
ncbi:MAG: DUF1320 family protein, partial [Isosphaeraceae bacterium]|nr:DUF1320 family protein [Isosphaeraceae bacterium]